MKKNIKERTLEKIERDAIKPKPKAYFQILKGLLYGSSLITLILAIYIFNLLFYLPERALRMAESGHWSAYLSLLPWPLLIFGSVTVGVLVYLYRNYEGGYKKHIGISAALIFIFVLVLGLGLAKSNVNERFEKRPGFRQFYEWNEENFVPRGPKRRLREDHINFLPPKKFERF